MTTPTPKHDLDHEVYIDPKDHKEHINHGMIEYTEEDLKMHNDAFHQPLSKCFVKLLEAFKRYRPEVDIVPGITWNCSMRSEIC